MERVLRLEDIRRAWETKDGDLADLVITLASLPDPGPGEDGAAPPRQGAPTFAAFAAEVQSQSFRTRKKPEERAHARIEGMKALEAPNAEVALPDRARLHEVILAMWADGGGFARDGLLQIIAGVPLTWGPWRALKRIFKEAEARGDAEIFGALAARFDVEFARVGSSVTHTDVSRRTLGYLVRRAWRRLRRQAEALPACYPDAAVDVLRFYPDQTRWTGTWIANHIFFHETHKFTRGRFKLDRRQGSLLTHRAYPELWRRTPRPLFTLLERARSEQSRGFAAAALKTDFRATLREVEPTWVARLVGVKSATVDDFVIWILANVPRFEQSAFRDLGLHTPVLTLLDSPSNDARAYAAAYARTHARTLPLDELIRLANNDHDEVRKLSRDLLHDRDPRKDVGLEGWGRLLGTPHGHELATAALRKHFGARELTPAWFKERLLEGSSQVFGFASDLLPKVHAPKALGADFFREVLDDPRLHASAARFALDALARFPRDAIDVDALKRDLLHPLTSTQVIAWIDEERIAPKDLGAETLKALAFHATWEEDAWVLALKKSGRHWARDLAFNEPLAHVALRWLSDVRKFSPADLGFEWLMRLAARSEPHYTAFAADYILRAFLPADFAPKTNAEGPASGGHAPAPTAPAEEDGERSPDLLEGESFLFTGKLATMTRSEATKKVTAANGKNASGVTAKLDNLVIGDDGSPLYGAGRKGSKQFAAEKLIAQGSAMKIISETAFLQRLAGETRTFSEDAITAGCEQLWRMATEPGPAGAPLQKLALKYLRHHHPDIGLELTDRPVDPGAEIPAEFLSFERVKPLFFDPREAIRAFALELARWELARQRPPIEAVVALCEAPHPEVRAFFAKALLSGETKEHQRFRIDPTMLTTEAVFSFCESLDAETRALGMQLIAKNPALAIPEELFRLTESPDRRVRAFVIRTLWAVYRDKGITSHWKPAAHAPLEASSALPAAAAAAKKSQPSGSKRETTSEKKGAPAAKSAEPAPERAEGPTRPASDGSLLAFLRRILFTIPPGRSPKGSANDAARAAPMPSDNAEDAGTAAETGPRATKRNRFARERLRPLPARKAKLGLIEVMRDLAVLDAAFAALATPLLEEFMGSRGSSERAACLVALTRIRKAHPSKDAA